jgi:hypothetical protein
MLPKTVYLSHQLSRLVLTDVDKRLEGLLHADDELLV